MNSDVALWISCENALHDLVGLTRLRCASVSAGKGECATYIRALQLVQAHFVNNNTCAQDRKSCVQVLLTCAQLMNVFAQLK